MNYTRKNSLHLILFRLKHYIPERTLSHHSRFGLDSRVLCRLLPSFERIILVSLSLFSMLGTTLFPFTVFYNAKPEIITNNL